MVNASKIHENTLLYVNSQQDLILSLYLEEGYTIADIAKELRVRDIHISSLLKENGIIVRKASTKNRALFHRYFENINSEAKAYLLGFITADGSVGYKKDRENGSGFLRLEVNKRDEEIIHFLARELNCKSKIYYDKRGKNTCTVSVVSTVLVQSLEKYYIRPQKTYELKTLFDNFGSKEIMRHYLRGLVDGDGSIYLSSNGQWAINLTAFSYDFLLDFKKHIESLVPEARCRLLPRKTKTAYCMEWKGNRAIEIAHFLYNGSDVYLTRKKNKYFEMVEWLKKRTQEVKVNKETTLLLKRIS